MAKYPKLNFPPIKLRARQRTKIVDVWDELRGTYVVLTPEEWVRQHLIDFLISHSNIPAKRIVQEYAVNLNGQPQRADVVVVDELGRPWLLAECKAAEVSIDKSVLSQAIRYNSVFEARYIVLTNGKRHFCYELTQTGYVPISAFPVLI